MIIQKTRWMVRKCQLVIGFFPDGCLCSQPRGICYFAGLKASGTQSRADAESPVVAEDSDYFTPEDTNTTILTVPKTNKHPEPTNNGDCTPQRWALPHHVTSLPGTPLSQSSVRSSGDSYSSTSSTRQLLGAGPGVAPAPGAPGAAVPTDPAC